MVTCTTWFMHKFNMSFVFHFHILELTSWIWTNPLTEGLKFESPSKWNSFEGFNLEHWHQWSCYCLGFIRCVGERYRMTNFVLMIHKVILAYISLKYKEKRKTNLLSISIFFMSCPCRRMQMLWKKCGGLGGDGGTQILATFRLDARVSITRWGTCTNSQSGFNALTPIWNI